MSEISKQALKVDNNTSFPDNNTGYISPSILRGFNTNMIDSLVDEITFTAFSSSVTSSIEQLSAFTASQQPAFNSLNAFTASQTLLNDGFTSQISSLQASDLQQAGQISALETSASLVNEIKSSNTSLGYARRFNFSGFMTASLVQNVDGIIADITVNRDSTKLNTSSFNDYTASTAATQSVFSASVATSISQSSYTFTQFSASQNIFNASITSSVQELLDLSSSLSGGYATQGELDAVSASLKQNINTLSSFTASYATTGSNTFYGTQNTFGDVLISGSITLAADGANGHAVQAKALFLSNSVQTGISVESGIHFYQVSKGDFYIQNNVAGVGSGSIYIGAINGANLNLSASAVNIDSDLYLDDLAGQTKFYINKDIDAEYVGIKTTWDENAHTLGVYGAEQNVELTYNGWGNTYDNGYIINVGQNGTEFKDWDNTYTNQTWLKVPVNGGANPAPILPRGVEITGSALGNVGALTISSNTASMDLSDANFFTLNLVSGSTTHLTATNIKKGQTINVLISQPSVGTGSVDYSSIFKFPNGASYTSTNISDAKDILTFITFDNSTIYATPVNNLV